MITRHELRMLRDTHRNRCARRAILLPIVLVAIALLALAIHIFAEQMLAEFRATRTMTGNMEAMQAAESGVDYLLATADRSQVRGKKLTQLSASDLRDKRLADIDGPRFSILASNGSMTDAVRYGLVDECSKLNLNYLAANNEDPLQARERLMVLPGMTAQIADRILDWIDADENARPLGGETYQYSSRRSSILPPQRPLHHLSELLGVDGVTQALLFGEDSNGNGWLDPSENDGALTKPLDNADGVLQAGWSQYLTVNGAESTWRDTNRRKINLNQKDLSQLFDALDSAVGTQAALFIVALRLEGPLQEESVANESATDARSERIKSAEKRLAQQLEQRSVRTRKTTGSLRSGLDLQRDAAFRIQSTADLVGQSVMTLIDGQQELLRSPWLASRTESALQELEQIFTTVDASELSGRININQAEKLVLRSVPTLNISQIDAMLQRRGPQTQTRGLGWLVTDGVLTLAQLRQAAPYITSGGDVFSGTAVGHHPFNKTAIGLHFTIDATAPYARCIRRSMTLPFPL